jgi:hypothetical protein
MAWRFDAGTLNVGETTTWSFWWDNNAYKGIQVVQARALPEDAGPFRLILPALFEVSSPGIKLELNGGYTYSITVTNKGPWSTRYEIVGDEV